MSARIGAWTIRLMAPMLEDYHNMDAEMFDKANQGVHDKMGDFLSEAEAFINEKLPEGFYVKIDDH